MSPLLILILLCITENQGDSSIPFVSFDPNWATVFTKESVTLTCNVDPPEPRDQSYYWYKDNNFIRMYQKSFKIDNPIVKYGGRYQCQISKGNKSEAVRLQVSHGWLALKVPAFVFEGDELYVSCAGYPGYSARDAVLYKDNKVIGSSPSDADFLVGRANMATSGLYRCTRQVKDGVIYYNYASEEYIFVRELFSKPVMEVNLNHPTEGDHMTITCDTKLSPRRATTELQFVFYRNGHNVQGFSFSNEYDVSSVQLGDSGKYTCEVRTKKQTVEKRSNEINIQVTELFSRPVMKVNKNPLTEGDHMSITCDTKLSPHRETTELQFAFYRNGHNVMGFSLSKQYGVSSVELGNSGKYSCEVRTKSNTVQKRSNEINIQVAAQQASKVTVRLEPPQGQIYAGEKLEVFCSVDKVADSLTFSWCKHNELHCEGKTARSKEQHFVVEAVPEDYSEEYQCIVTREYTQDSIRSTKIKISVSVRLPLLTVSLKEVAVGDIVVLLCESKSRFFPKEYQFYHMEDFLGSIKGDQKAAAQFNVTITSLTMAGPFICVVQNNVFSPKSEGVTLFVMEPVENATISPGIDVLEVMMEHSLCLTCSVAKGTNPSFLWFYNNEKVENFHVSGLYQVEYESEKILCVDPVQQHHAGIYQCQASNQLPHNKTFIAKSHIVTITITERSYAVMGIGITLALPILVVVMALLLYKFSNATSLSFFFCHFCPPSPGGSCSNTPARQQETARHQEMDRDSSWEQNQYIDAPMEDPANEKDVCYTYIDIKPTPKGPSVPTSEQGEGSVTYAVVKSSAIQGGPKSIVYENFNAK
ncbi:Fc receptor-like protein 3 isoform X2 [Xenopus laevis]|uniref:Fc receptor-like protein 3 isoform X2 n=1 Tax=Xenopus laevis TaxID=8355 RepID=A0A8J1LLN5_XENLA|nr:Fc receptor-like protein 3 isoform X2 [Xenopus laevis]